MRRLAVLLIALCAPAAVPGPARADLGGYTISDFRADLVVGRDAGLTVTEHITVDFSEARHGIYRTIPVRYTDPKGFLYDLGFRFGGVTDGNGHAYAAKVTDQGHYVNIRIGSADHTVSGRREYLVRYSVRRGLGHFPDHDELYWNATGNEWQAEIQHASATVHLPVDLPADSLQAFVYTGRFGARGEAATVGYPAPGEIQYRTTGPLAPLEGLTVDAVWPVGYVTFPGPAARIAQFAADNWIMVMPVLFAALLFWLYRTRGRDPEGPAAVMVRYEAPPGLTPGELGTVVDEKVDLRDITATLVDLAVRGYLVIKSEEQKGLLGLLKHTETVFERLDGKPWEDLLPHERKLLDALFETGDRVEAADLKNRFYVHLPAVRNALYDRLVKERYFAARPASVRGAYIGGGIAAGVATLLVGLLWAKARGGIMPNALVFPLIAGGASAFLFFGFAPTMPRRTKAGVEMRSWARGFEEFVHRVERERLEADRARNVFESLLPYAMALGVAGAWAKRFEGIYAEGASPAWYVGAYPGAMFSTRSFEQNLSSAMSQAGQSFASTPRSSGSSGAGGGGFSGGGGGGGGGGSW